jgi:tryptophanyl-tRNA synthetase
LKKVFSGIQPTGNLHLGNYLGAIRNWLDLQGNHQCLFGVMNLHAITVEQNPRELENNVLIAVATYLACGLDPQKSKIFVQSEVSEHAELAWVLSTLTPMGWLNRMTQFKDKIGSGFGGGSGDGAGFGDGSGFGGDRENKNANLGLYSYPVLMASDILLYNADFVPVGEDQKQHLELTRDLAGAFNRRYKTTYFKLPEPLIIKEVKRIMSLQDGTKKMSKSDVSEISRINLNDSADEILKKIKKSKTDSVTTIAYDESRPEIYNLLNIFAVFAKKTPQEIAKEYENSGYGKFKQDLADLLISSLEPISTKITQLLNDKIYLQKILQEGGFYAKQIASKTKDDVYKIIGLN